MGIKKTNTGYQADFHPAPGVRERKSFKLKGDAAAWLAGKSNGFNVDPVRAARRKDTRKLSALAQLWFDLHGATLKQGEHRLLALVRTCRGLGDPAAHQLTANFFGHYRMSRVKRVSANTVNHEHAYLRAMINELKRLGEWNADNPLDGLKLYRIPPTELSFLSPDQITALRAELAASLNPSALPVALVCLATGARWGEAQGLCVADLAPGRLRFVDTKNNRSRTVPVDVNFSAYLDRFRRGQNIVSGAIFAPCYDAFSNALERAGIVLPAGQRTHVLRHTYASNFIQMGGAITTLREILGHATIQMTMRYAHLAPEHLADAVKFNPLGHFMDTLWTLCQNAHNYIWSENKKTP